MGVIFAVGLLTMGPVAFSYWISARTFQQDAELIPLADSIEVGRRA